MNSRHFIQLLLSLTLLTSTLAARPRPDAKRVEGPPDPRFGAVEAYMAPEQAADLRLGWDRMVIRWDARQPNGPDEWKVPADEAKRLADAESAGREVTAILMGTPRWATDTIPIGGPPRGLDLPYDDPANLWGNFVRRIVAEHKGQIKHWIIWNEPDIAIEEAGAQFAGSVDDYYRLLKTAYLAAKEVDPGAVIHLAGLTYWHDVVNNRPLYLGRLLERISQDPDAASHNDYFDVATAHVYFKTDDVYIILKAYRGLLDGYGLKQPIWLNETNAAPVDDPKYPVVNPPLLPVTMEQQSAFVIQVNALALAAGAERVAIYKFFDDAPVTATPGGDPYSYGLIRPDGSPRPALEALRVVTTHFTSVKTAALTDRPNYFIVKLDRGGAITRVAWARGDKPVTLKLRPTPNAVNATLFDAQGEAHPLTIDEKGNYKLSLPPAVCTTSDGCFIGGQPWVLIEIVPTADH